MNLEGSTISITVEKDIRHDQWWEELKASAREHDARVDAARADKPSDDALHSLAHLQKYIAEKEKHNQWWQDMKQQARENDMKLAADALARDIKQQQSEFASLDAFQESLRREAKHREYLELLAMAEAGLNHSENDTCDTEKSRKRKKRTSMSVWARMFPNAYSRRAIRRADRAIAAEREIVAAQQLGQAKSESTSVAVSTKTISESLDLEHKTISQMLFNDAPAAATETQSVENAVTEMSTVENAAPIALLPEKALSRFNGDTAQYMMNKWFNETNSMRSAKNRVREIPMVSAKENAPAPVADVAAIEQNMELVARKFAAAQVAVQRADQASARAEKCADDLALKIERLESAKNAAATSKQATVVRRTKAKKAIAEIRAEKCADDLALKIEPMKLVKDVAPKSKQDAVIRRAKAKKALAEIRAKNLRIAADAAMADAVRAKESIGVIEDMVNAARVTQIVAPVATPSVAVAPATTPVVVQPMVNNIESKQPVSKTNTDAANDLAQEWIDLFQKAADDVEKEREKERQVQKEQDAAVIADKVQAGFELAQYVSARDDEIRNACSTDSNMQSVDDDTLVLRDNALAEYRRLQRLREVFARKSNLADIDPVRGNRFRDVSINRLRVALQCCDGIDNSLSARDMEIERERDEFNTKRMQSISAMYDQILAR